MESQKSDGVTGNKYNKQTYRNSITLSY